MTAERTAQGESQRFSGQCSPNMDARHLRSSTAQDGIIVFAEVREGEKDAMLNVKIPFQLIARHSALTATSCDILFGWCSWAPSS